MKEVRIKRFTLDATSQFHIRSKSTRITSYTLSKERFIFDATWRSHIPKTLLHHPLRDAKKDLSSMLLRGLTFVRKDASSTRVVG